MTAQSLLRSTILKRVMTVFLFVLTQKRVMVPIHDNVLGLMRVMCGTRVTLLAFSTREYWFSLYLRCEVRAFEGGVKTAEEDDDGVGLPSLPPATPPPVCTIGLSVSKSMRSCPAAPLPVEEEEEAVLLGCLRIPPEVSEALPRLTTEPPAGWTPP